MNFWKAALAASFLLPLVAGEAAACRCAPRALAAHFADAEEVLLGRLVASDERDGERRLHFIVEEAPWKVARTRSEPLRAGERVSYRTAMSTAACGVQPQPEATYLVFGRADPGRAGRLRVDLCSGTRVYRPVTGPAVDFDDVPARSVPGRLNALGATNVLRAVVANAPRGTDPDNTALIGLLDLPGLAHGGVAPVQAVRDPAADAIAIVRTYDDVTSRELAYEQSGAVVFARVDGWFRVRLADGTRGWVAPDDAGTFFPYAELPVRRLAYLHGQWSGYVWPEPGAGLPNRSAQRSVRGREEFYVEAHESKPVGGMPWFRVDVLRGNPCDGGDVRVELSGWVPGYGASGQPIVWFHSRGC